MTVSSSTRRVQYNTNGTTGPWTVPFYFLEDSHLSVVYTTSAGASTTLTLSTHYTVTGAGVLTGGSVTTIAAYAAGGTITIVRNVPATQETDYVETDPFPAESHERALDKLTMLAQQAQEGIERAVRAPLGEVLNELPDPPDRADKFLSFDSDGQPVLIVATDGSAASVVIDLANTSDPAKGGGMVGFNSSLDYADNTVGGALADMHGRQQFNLYVATTGDDALNDGLTILTPFATLQKAFDTLMDIGNVGGQRTINLAAGTYTLAASQRLGPKNEDDITDPNLDTYLSDGVKAVNWILIQGPDVGYDPASDPWPTPTAIIDCDGVAAIGIQLEGIFDVLVKNVKILDATAIGVSNDGGSLRTENVHTSGCVIGISSFRGRLEVRGGWLYGNAGKTLTGIRSMFVNYHSIGTQGALGAGQGPLISYMSVGLLAQELATGHSDSVSYEDCSDAIRVSVDARVNYSYSDFKRCTRAIRADFNSVVFGATTADFNHGTADANDECVVIQAGARDVDREAYTGGACLLASMDPDDVPLVITGTTTNTSALEYELDYRWFAPNTLYSIRKPIVIKMHAAGTIAVTGSPGTLGTKFFGYRLGSTVNSGVTVSAVEHGDWSCDGTMTLHNYNVQSSSFVFNVHLHETGKNTYVDVDTGTEDLKANGTTTLRFEIQPTDAGDSFTVNQCSFEVWG